MNLPNRLPELEHYTISDNKTVYYLQKISKYDEGYTHSSIIGVYGSLEGDIDKATQDAIRQAKEFCKYNEVEPHILTIRKIKATISSEEIESKSERFCNESKKKILKCASCSVNINYGDEVVIKKYESDDKYFCCNDCLAEYEDATVCFQGDSEYDKLFIESDELYQ